jgi:hypothetical protein
MKGTSMSAPHDFEFQLGRNRALKGRGWRGLLALGLLLIACVVTAPGTIPRIITPIYGAIAGIWIK